ncbi:Triosephosphate isomerase [Filobasidium floriforme]|uniref:Triosephosphate isomerase n=1 Tax=Filobasidium floriforme TaxID=5210 RepID=UPI001E8E73B9|nr:Triosephosphate isomerase [Filobasidium floriforme]KAH8084256.1 Triosephosphate isomerase [Filobasidium floriforme]
MVNQSRQFFVGGNFKMNGSVKSVSDLIKGMNEAKLDGKTEVVVAPPALYLLQASKEVQPPIQISAQNCHTAAYGAFTGEIAPAQLVDAQIPWVIIGHSERRQMFGDTVEFVADKTKAAVEAGLKVILCIGETLEERKGEKTDEVNQRQLQSVVDVLDEKAWSDIVIAYEPVWAIGTGLTATPQQAQEVHASLRKWMAGKVSQEVADKIRIIYGGSVNGKNCRELAKEADIDGFLVGGASIKPEFIDICKAAE